MVCYFLARISPTQSAADAAASTALRFSRPPQRTAESTLAVALGHPLAGHAPCIHNRLHRLATIMCEKCKLEFCFPRSGRDENSPGAVF